MQHAVNMHTNYRRPNKFRAKHHNRPTWPMIYSSRYLLQEFWGRARAAARDMIHHERYDDCPTRYPQSIMWDYW